jgi:glutamate synthase (NADPH/NADH)
MGLNEDFDDRQTQALAESEEYHPYEYQTENNGSWAGALPVKQYVSIFFTCASQCILISH